MALIDAIKRSMNDSSYDDGGDFIDALPTREIQTRPYNRTSSLSLYGAGPQYQEPFLDDETQQKIVELRSIAQKIESLQHDDIVNYDFSKYKIDYQNALNPQQLRAATTINGPVLVIAGAGSGKTRTLIHRVAFLLENGVEAQKILLLTFTRKASNEMLHRVGELLKNESSKNVVGGTFHAFANMMMRKYSAILNIPPNFTIIDTVDAEDIIDLIKKELKFAKRPQAFPKKGRVHEIISSASNRNLSISDVIMGEYSGLMQFISDIELIAEKYEKYKRVNNLYDYDDLMTVLRDSLRDNPLFREKMQSAFLYVMVDEFQDTNIVQKEIVDLIVAKHKNIMVVGDDTQSIYSFRGAHYENILRFPETYPECSVVKIVENYRSHQGILDYTNDIINAAKLGYKKALVSPREVANLPVVHSFATQYDEAAYIVDQILQLREQNIPLKEMAVIYRASYHGDFIQAELLKRNIPYVVYGGIKFIERRHVKDVVAYLRIVLNPLDAVAWNRILTLLPGVGSVSATKIVQRIHQLGGSFDFSSFPESKFKNELIRLGSVLTQIQDQTMPVSSKIETLTGYYGPILEMLEDDYIERMKDLDVLYTISLKYEELDAFLSDFALDPPSNKYQDRNNPLVDEAEEKPLVLTTVHSAKGLEWYTVFVPHLLDGLFPSVRSIKTFEQLEEERRLFYVACSRAKQNLYLTMPSYVVSYDAYFNLPSRFLVEVGQDKYKIGGTDEY
jgi:DNA helicase-2/ATP-dependent DNA helicase PcrA